MTTHLGSHLNYSAGLRMAGCWHLLYTADFSSVLMDSSIIYVNFIQYLYDITKHEIYNTHVLCMWCSNTPCILVANTNTLKFVSLK